MFKKLVALLTIFLIYVSSALHALAVEISAPSGILIDFNTGQILYQKNAYQKMYPASTTKILTAIIAIERGNLNDIVTVPKEASPIDGSKIYLTPGEQLTLEQLLYAIMLESANDAAVSIAVHIGGSVENFAKLMNQKAKELGAKNSNFVNPNGLPNPNHYTTAYDLSQIARYAMQNPKFREIVSTVHYTIPPTNKFDKPRELYNSNRLIKATSYHYEGADGIKTGYTVVAKETLVASATRNGHRLITVVMGAEGRNIWTDTITLLNYGFNNFTYKKLSTKNEVIKELPIGKGTIHLATDRDAYYTVKKEDENRIEKNIVLNKNIKKPIKSGEVLGFVEYKLNGNTIEKVKLISLESVDIFGNIKSGKSSNPFDKYLKWSIILFSPFIGLYAVRFIIKKRRKNSYLFQKKKGW